MMHKEMLGLAVLAVLTGASAGDAKKKPVAPVRMAVATLQAADGTMVGRASVREVPGGLRVTVDAHGLSAGEHGVHIHTKGLCEGPDFMSAGGHWNPTGAKHGARNPAGPHEGDLPNLVIGKDGRGNVGVIVPGASFDTLIDADGAAMVVHAGADDLVTDPSGNSGARVACGVFSAG